MKTKIEIQLNQLTKALARLAEVLALRPTQIHKDATIQRFEFCFELSWKLMQSIAQKESQDVFGPSNSIRAAAQLGLIDDVEMWFDFHDARNLSTHIYDEKTADVVYKLTKKYLPEAEKLVERAKNFL